MPKALIAYFSQGGTTEAIAKKISDGLQDEKFQVDLHNIAESKPPDISEYDMIGIGSPVYIFRPPFNVFKKNISFDRNDLPKWGRDCILCFYCEMKCPEDAITSPVDWLIMAPFMNYNVLMGIKNRSIDKVKVVHSKGKTVRIENNT